MDYRNSYNPDCVKCAQLSDEIVELKAKIKSLENLNKLFNKMYDWPGDYDYVRCPMCKGKIMVGWREYPSSVSNKKICYGSLFKGCKKIKQPHFHRKCKSCGYKYITKTAEDVLTENQ